MDSLLGGGTGQQRSAPDTAAIKNSETAILQQLAQLRCAGMGVAPIVSQVSLSRSVVEGKSGGGIASEQLQPLYEVKTLVQQNSQRLAALEQRLKVRSKFNSISSFLSLHCRTRLLTSVLL